MNVRIALAQMNAAVGDLVGNRERIERFIAKARAVRADVVVFPELATVGQPAHDLLLQRDFISQSMKELMSLRAASEGLTVIVGTPYAGTGLHAGSAFPRAGLLNAAAIFHDGELVTVYGKNQLAGGSWGEERYFQPGQHVVTLRRAEVVLGVNIGEDLDDPAGPLRAQVVHGEASVILHLSATPFRVGNHARRERWLAGRAYDNRAFVVHCNLVGGQDEFVFHGHSLVCDPYGEVVARAAAFEEELLVADLDLQNVTRRRLIEPSGRSLGHREFAVGSSEAVQEVVLPEPGTTELARAARPEWERRLASPLGRVEEIYEALVTGTRDYVRKNGFPGVVVGLSGGLDSALTAAVAADAVGPGRVSGVAMPSRYSSLHGLEDARQQAKNVGIRYIEIPIDTLFQAFLDTLEPLFEGYPSGVTEENLQPRIRGTLLMALSNKFGWLVLTTGNKSEVGVGYSTLYGDTAGGLAVLKDVSKTLVYELAHYRNERAGYDLIPQRVLDKPPSAELRPDQKDTDSLPEYATLDPILQAYVEENRSVGDIVQAGFAAETVRCIIGMVDRNEYKRRQNPPGIHITERGFGLNWRWPITNRYRP